MTIKIGDRVTQKGVRWVGTVYDYRHGSLGVLWPGHEVPLYNNPNLFTVVEPQLAIDAVPVT